MAKVVGIGTGISGKVGNVQYKTVKGQQIIQTKATPLNRQSNSQTSNRSIFTQLNDLFKPLSKTLIKRFWNPFVIGKRSGWSVCLSVNQKFQSEAISLGPEIITNGGFAVDSTWIKGTGWDIDVTYPGKAHCNGSQPSTSYLWQTIPVSTINKSFLISFTVSNYLASKIHIGLGGHTWGLWHTSNGVFIEIVNVIPPGEDFHFYLGASIYFIGSVDNVSCREILPFKDDSIDYSKLLITQGSLPGERILSCIYTALTGTLVITWADFGFEGSAPKDFAMLCGYDIINNKFFFSDGFALRSDETESVILPAGLSPSNVYAYLFFYTESTPGGVIKSVSTSSSMVSTA